MMSTSRPAQPSAHEVETVISFQQPQHVVSVVGTNLQSSLQEELTRVISATKDGALPTVLGQQQAVVGPTTNRVTSEELQTDNKKPAVKMAGKKMVSFGSSGSMQSMATDEWRERSVLTPSEQCGGEGRCCNPSAKGTAAGSGSRSLSSHTNGAGFYSSTGAFKNPQASSVITTNSSPAMARTLSQQFYKTRMCPFFERGHCRKDSECTYAHSKSELKTAPDLYKTKLCDEWQNGTCVAEGNCRFAHGRQELRFTSQVYKTRICHFWLTGECSKGRLCRHAHGREELRVDPHDELEKGGAPAALSYKQKTCDSVPEIEPPWLRRAFTTSLSKSSSSLSVTNDIFERQLSQPLQDATGFERLGRCRTDSSMSSCFPAMQLSDAATLSSPSTEMSSVLNPVSGDASFTSATASLSSSSNSLGAASPTSHAKEAQEPEASALDMLNDDIIRTVSNVASCFDSPATAATLFRQPTPVQHSASTTLGSLAARFRNAAAVPGTLWPGTALSRSSDLLDRSFGCHEQKEEEVRNRAFKTCVSGTGSVERTPEHWRSSSHNYREERRPENYLFGDPSSRCSDSATLRSPSANEAHQKSRTTTSLLTRCLSEMSCDMDYLPGGMPPGLAQEDNTACMRLGTREAAAEPGDEFMTFLQRSASCPLGLQEAFKCGTEKDDAVIGKTDGRTAHLSTGVDTQQSLMGSIVNDGSMIQHLVEAIQTVLLDPTSKDTRATRTLSPTLSVSDTSDRVFESIIGAAADLHGSAADAGRAMSGTLTSSPLLSPGTMPSTSMTPPPGLPHKHTKATSQLRLSLSAADVRDASFTTLLSKRNDVDNDLNSFREVNPHAWRLPSVSRVRSVASASSLVDMHNDNLRAAPEWSPCEDPHTFAGPTVSDSSAELTLRTSFSMDASKQGLEPSEEHDSFWQRAPHPCTRDMDTPIASRGCENVLGPSTGYDPFEWSDRCPLFQFSSLSTPVESEAVNGGFSGQCPSLLSNAGIVQNSFLEALNISEMKNSSSLHHCGPSPSLDHAASAIPSFPLEDGHSLIRSLLQMQSSPRTFEQGSY